MRSSSLSTLGLLAFAHAAVLGPRKPAESGLCNRSCLTKITADYVDALQLKNLTYVALDANVQYTDAGVERSVGTGLMWTILGGVRLPWRQAIYDADTGAVFFNAILTNWTDDEANYGTSENSSSWAFTARLKVQNRLITEIEEIHNLQSNNGTGFTAFNLDQFHEPDRTWDDFIPLSEQSTAEDLKRIAYSYWVTVNGTHPAIGPGAVFGPECQRLEDFSYTTNAPFVAGGCGPGIPIWLLSNPRIHVADPTRGVVAGFFNLEKPGRHIVVSEWFKIKDGYISQLEAFFDLQGQNASGWPSFENYTTLAY